MDMCPQEGCVKPKHVDWRWTTQVPWNILVNLFNIIIKFRYPFPLAPATLEQFHGARAFSNLYLQSAYNCVWIWKEDKWKANFVMPKGPGNEYQVMPYGLASALRIPELCEQDVPGVSPLVCHHLRTLIISRFTPGIQLAIVTTWLSFWKS